MPGPLWKHAVKDLDDKLNRCGVQAENVRTMNEEPPTFRKEIFNNGNTLVEVAIKTHKPKSQVPTKTRRIVTTRHHKPGKASKAVSHGTHGPPQRNQWRELLAESNLDSQETSKASSIEPGKKSKDKAESGKSLRPKKRSQESNRHPRDEVDAVHGRFQNRTLRVFLKEMRSALNSDRDPEKASKILDDLEYVALNLKQDTLDASAERSKLKNMSNSSRAKASSSQNHEISLELRAKNEQIQELKAMITRLTANNNDMLALLTQKVGLEDSLKVAKSANQELLKKLTDETKKTINLSTKLSSAEQEIQRLRIVVKDMKSSLHSDLQEALRPLESRSSKPPGSNNETVELMLSELEDQSEKESKEDDQADSAIHSESHPLSNHELEPSQKIIQEAKEMIENKRDFTPVVLDLSETRADLTVETTSLEEHVPRQEKKPSKKNVIDPSGLQSRADANVKAFLDRMRNQDSLNLTLPKVPNAKTFDETTTTLHFSGVSDIDTTRSLSESKFRKGLEHTDLVTSDPE